MFPNPYDLQVGMSRHLIKKSSALASVLSLYYQYRFECLYQISSSTISYPFLRLRYTVKTSIVCSSMNDSTEILTMNFLSKKIRRNRCYLNTNWKLEHGCKSHKIYRWEITQTFQISNILHAEKS